VASCHSSCSIWSVIGLVRLHCRTESLRGGLIRLHYTTERLDDSRIEETDGEEFGGAEFVFSLIYRSSQPNSV
jgi:hypothetical protein